MAAAAAFKQPCPSCEALVPVKDVSLVGKKIDCPKCKYRFVVESPAPAKGTPPAADKAKKDKPAPDVPKKQTAPAKGADAAKKKPEAAKKKSEAIQAQPPNKPAAAAKGKPAKPPIDDDEELDALDESDPGEGGAEEPDNMDEAITARPDGKSKVKANGKGAQGGPLAPSLPEEEDLEKPEEDEDEEARPKKKKKGLSANSKKLYMGLGLAAVGLVVLVVAALLMRGKTEPPGKIVKGNPGIPGGGPPPTQPAKDQKKTEKETAPKKSGEGAILVEENTLPPAGLELTNLLPNTTEHVARLNFNELLKLPLGEAVFQVPGGLNDDELKDRLGFALRGVDTVLRGQSFSSRWSFNVVHTMRALDEKSLIHALDLAPADGSPLKGQSFYKFVSRNPWLDQFGQLSLSPQPGRDLEPDVAKRPPLFVRLHDRQTLIVASEVPMMEFLRGSGRFPVYSNAASKDGQKGKGQPAPEPAPSGPPGNYMTIKPALRAMLERLEKVPDGASGRLLFLSATDMNAAPAANPKAEDRPRTRWRARQLWDVTDTLNDTTNRIRVLGTAILARDSWKFVFQNRLECSSEADAKDLKADLISSVAPVLASFFHKVLEHSVEVVKEAPPVDPKVKPIPGPMPLPKPASNEPKNSRVRVLQNDKQVNFVFELLPASADRDRFLSVASVLVAGVRSELEAGAGTKRRHTLAKAAHTLAETGNTDRDVKPGHFPYGAFKRPQRTVRQPDQRISWMAGLLPFLGHDNLYHGIDWDTSWKHPRNWVVARAIVPEFLDPSYPEHLRRVPYPGVSLDVGATHFVGIAGVGLEAADYALNDPAVIDKLGVLGYDRSMALDQVKKGHGLANTIFLVQVPPDGVAGVTPWMAGGGSTLRGVPEKNSIRPFVRDYGDGKRGTYALMTDGSVRFISADISDDLFKILCTVHGRPPEELEKVAPLVPESKRTAPAADKDEKKPAKTDKDEKKSAPMPTSKEDKKPPAPTSKENNKPAPAAKGTPQAMLEMPAGQPSSFPRSAWQRTVATLCVASRCLCRLDAERQTLRSHAERGNEGACELVFQAADPAALTGT